MLCVINCIYIINKDPGHQCKVWLRFFRNHFSFFHPRPGLTSSKLLQGGVVFEWMWRSSRNSQILQPQRTHEHAFFSWRGSNDRQIINFEFWLYNKTIKHITSVQPVCCTPKGTIPYRKGRIAGNPAHVQYPVSHRYTKMVHVPLALMLDMSY